MPYPYGPPENEQSSQLEEISPRQEVAGWILIALTHGLAVLGLLYFLVFTVGGWLVKRK